MGSSLVALCMALCLAILTPWTSAGKVTNPKNVPKDAILLSNVESLTFRAGKMTASRRVSPVPQLNCVGPSHVCKLYHVDVMRCTNEGAEYDAETIQWACRAALPEYFKLGSTDVSCEGYASRDDPYVLKGSCGVDYRLLLTDKGEEKFGHRHRNSFSGESDSSNLAVIVFFLIFGLVLFVIIRNMIGASRRNPPRLGGNNNRPPWFGGGGGGGDGNDPPPPYDSHNFSQPRKPRSYGTSSRGSAGNSSRSAGEQTQGWRPGPWTAGAVGAGLGYAFGRTQNRTQPWETAQRPGSFFGGGGGGGVGRNTRRDSPPSFSSSRYESTGFGSTSRR